MTAGGTRDAARALPLSALERAAGLVAGAEPGLAPALPVPDHRPARRVLEDLLLDSLAGPRCVVSFSGGRDSSAVLATAVAVARREGLPLPVPVTLRFPGVASTVEDDWQERTIGHLGVSDWERIRIGSELDLLGDVACGCLTRYGLLWPPNAYFHEPLFRAARGGRLLTGLDGDGLFGAWRWARAASVLARRQRPGPKDAARVAIALLPPALRTVAVRRQPLPPVTWLRPAAHAAFARLWTVETAKEPRRWDRRLAWYIGRRYLHLAQHSLALVAAGVGAQVRHPLAEPAFLAALARDGRAAGWGGRTETMRALFADVLPAAVIERRPKAEFGRALWRERARAFAAGWDGDGVDAAMVDAGALRAAWAAENPWFASITPLHTAWLAAHGAPRISRTSGGSPDPRPRRSPDAAGG
jgi:asparagine synthase (glutamine-hydrolysing)